MARGRIDAALKRAQLQMQGLLCEGVLHLHVDVRVSLAELRSWPPDCIAALFAGIAEVQTAQAQARQRPPRGRP